ncbi:MAG: methylated-DNA--[protein]-cysteine S-methyltransferase [Propionibacteriaceae bacterium]|jgi:methylated-DNA-[protein]-cysteine S-methyltransferase|nr:methylated-DNA--[protein]-cysteine S-methyltransferase [Propionibacteriaceae bacterium]
MTIRQARFSSPLGPIAATSEGGAVTQLWFEPPSPSPAEAATNPSGTAPTRAGDAIDAPAPRPGRAPARRSDGRRDAADPPDPVLERLGEWLADYFAGGNPTIDFPLAPRGTPFRMAVWSLLCEIPYGQTTTYGALAARLSGPGRPLAARAVGGAVGHNPISLLIPCHRVIGSDSSLTGYGGGLDRKASLLALEGSWPKP